MAFDALVVRKYLTPKYRFTLDNVPDSTERVAIITVGNTDVGKETVKAFHVPHHLDRGATRVLSSPVRVSTYGYFQPRTPE